MGGILDLSFAALILKFNEYKKQKGNVLDSSFAELFQDYPN